MPSALPIDRMGRCGVEDQILYEGHSSLIRYFGRIAIAVFFLLLALSLVAVGGGLTGETSGAFNMALLSVAAIAWTWIRCHYGTRWTLYATRLVQQEGLISRKTSEVDLEDIRNVQVSQSAMQRIVGIGDVLVSTAARNEEEVAARSIRAPQEFADLISRQKGALKNHSAA